MLRIHIINLQNAVHILNCFETARYMIVDRPVSRYIVHLVLH